MWFKQFAFTQEQAQLLAELVEEELRFAHVTHERGDYLSVTQTLLDLYAELNEFSPKDKKNDSKTNQEKNPDKENPARPS